MSNHIRASVSGRETYRAERWGRERQREQRGGEERDRERRNYTQSSKGEMEVRKDE